MPSLALLLLLSTMADETVTGVDPVVVRVDDDVCVDRAGLTALVELRAGIGSVVDDGPRVIAVGFTGRPPQIVVDITLDVDGQRVGARRLGPFADCGSAIDAAALAIALVIDPFGTPPPPTAAPSPPPTPTPPARAPAPASLARRPPVEGPPRAWELPPFSLGLGAALGVGIGLGVAPGPMGIVRLHLAAAALPVAVGVGGRVDAATPLLFDGDRRLESVGGAFFVEGCGRLDRVDDVGSLLLDLCGLGEVGGLRAVAVGFLDPVQGNASFATVGAAMTARVPLAPGLGAFVRVGATVPVLPARLDSGGATLWETPLVNGQVTVGLDGLSRHR
jgi:hypothetical protein